MSEFKTRRENLLSLMKENSIAIIFAGVPKLCSEDEYYPFCSNRNFFYLTNIEQDNSVLLLVNGVGEKKEFLFIDEYNALKEKWTGKRLGYDEASKLSDIDNLYSNNVFETTLNLILGNEAQYGKIETIYLDLTPEIKIRPAFSTVNFQDELKEKFPNVEIQNVYPYIKNLRMIKSNYEVECIKKAIKNTNIGINILMNHLKSGVLESDLSDLFEFEGRKLNKSALAFSTITASDKNALCLHYPTQIDYLKDDSLVLFDLGYKYLGYSADISRTYPVNGVYSRIQKEIYQAVLNCNKAVIEYIKPGVTIKDLQDYAKDFLKNECVKRKLLKEDEDIMSVYYHNISHHLGLDTHDISDRDSVLKAGNVITVEPGLYFAKYNIGVRIEDDVLVTESGSINLSSEIKKEINEIEELLKTRR